MNFHKKIKNNNENDNEEKININGKKERSLKDKKNLKIRISNIEGNGGFAHDDIENMEDDDDAFSDKSYRKIKKIKKNLNTQKFENPIEKPQKMDEEIFVEEYN